MATPNTKSETESVISTEIPALAQKSREQLVSNLQQGQQLSIDAAQSWVDAVSALPVMDLPKISGFADALNLQSATNYTFDLASDLLNAQRDFVSQLTKVLTPAKTV